MMRAIILFLLICFCFSCQKNKSFFENGYEGLSFFDTYLTLETPTTINELNVHSYSLSGSCNTNGKSIVISIGTLSYERSCLLGSWNLKGVNLSSLPTGNIAINVSLKSTGKSEGTSISKQVTNTRQDLVDDDNSLEGFGGGSHNGTSFVSSKLTLSSQENRSSFDETWTPQYSNLVAYWQMEESSWNGTAGEVLDSSDQNRAGTAFVGASTNTTSKIGVRSGVFNSVNYFQATPPLISGQLSISTWIKIPTGDLVGADPTWGRGIIRSIYNDQTHDYLLGVLPDGAVCFTYWENNGVDADGSKKTEPGLIVENRWHHIVATYSSGTYKIFVDGVEATTLTSFSTSSGWLTGFEIGRTWTSAGFGWKGNIDELAIWDSALSSGSIRLVFERQKAIYSGTFESRIMDKLTTSNWQSLITKTPTPFFKELTGDSNSDNTPESEPPSDYTDVSGTLSNLLTGLWHLNSNAQDSSGSNNNGTVQGASSTSSGKFKEAYSFDGVNDYIDFDHISSASNLTISLWVYPRSYTSSGHNPRLLMNYDGAADLQIILRESGYFIWGSTAQAAGAGTTALPPLNQWTHIVVTKNSSTYKIFYNGVEQIVVPRTPGNPIPALATLRLGADIAGTLNDGEFNGKLDEAAIWNRALSTSEIISLYRRGANRLKYQVRSCNNSNCSGDLWLGPDGTSYTYFSELYNRKTAGFYDVNGEVQTDSLSLTFNDFIGPWNRRYFQYRVIMESDDTNTLCMGLNCVPSIESISLDP